MVSWYLPVTIELSNYGKSIKSNYQSLDQSHKDFQNNYRCPEQNIIFGTLNFNMINREIKIIAFDADDTLWVNETYFRESEEEFYNILSPFAHRDDLAEELLEIEVANLDIYGYGVKPFVLSMLETALKICGDKLTSDMTRQIIEIGRQQLNKPVNLLPHVTSVLESLSEYYEMIVITKGDLLDQENKLRLSGLLPYFREVKVVSEKTKDDYKKIITGLKINSDEFLMVGNSLKSDILPVLENNAHAVHVPIHNTWIYEHIDVEITHPRFREIPEIKELLNILPKTSY